MIDGEWRVVDEVDDCLRARLSQGIEEPELSMGGDIVCVTNEENAPSSLLAGEKELFCVYFVQSVAGQDQRLVHPHLQQPRMQRCKAPSSTSHH